MPSKSSNLFLFTNYLLKTFSLVSWKFLQWNRPVIALGSRTGREINFLVVFQKLFVESFYFQVNEMGKRVSDMGKDAFFFIQCVCYKLEKAKHHSKHRVDCSSSMDEENHHWFLVTDFKEKTREFPWSCDLSRVRERRWGQGRSRCLQTGMLTVTSAQDLFSVRRECRQRERAWVTELQWACCKFLS